MCSGYLGTSCADPRRETYKEKHPSRAAIFLFPFVNLKQASLTAGISCADPGRETYKEKHPSRAAIFLFPFVNLKQASLTAGNKKSFTMCEAFLCGGRGIRTPGGVTLNSFQDCRIRPLCHSSFAGANIGSFFCSQKIFLRFERGLKYRSKIYLHPFCTSHRPLPVLITSLFRVSKNSSGKGNIHYLESYQLLTSLLWLSIPLRSTEKALR